MDTYFNLESYIQSRMADAIAKHGLVLGKGNGGLATLSNAHVVAEFENIDNNYVRFNFFQPAQPEIKFEFAEFLDACFDERSKELRPLPPKEWENERQLNFMLDNYNSLILEGYFSKPISGDYSWLQKYLDLKEENDRLSKARANLRRANHPEAKAIFAKRMDGDPTWKDDVKRILAEQNSKS